MRRSLYLITILLCAFFRTETRAAVKVGDYAHNFYVKDITGKSHYLYQYLDSGYTVIIDVSATWCGPCWNFHKSGVLEKLYQKYGPGGSVSPGKIMVFWIEGVAATTVDDIRGIPTYAGATQGDWTAGSTYPMCDDAYLAKRYEYGGYPSFTVICRDRRVSLAKGGSTPEMMTEKFWLDLSNRECPSYSATLAPDAKIWPRLRDTAYYCQAAPTVSFQNYSRAQMIQAATINTYSGTTLMNSYKWAGSLSPMMVQDVTLPAFTPAPFGQYRFEVVIPNDSRPANNFSADSVFKVYSPTNGQAVPWSEDFESSAGVPYRFDIRPYEHWYWMRPENFENNGRAPVGVDGKPTRAFMITLGAGYRAVNRGEAVLGNFDLTTMDNPVFRFDYAGSMWDSTLGDSILIQASTDCGGRWTNLWVKSGEDLSTALALGAGGYKPARSSEWREVNLPLAAYKSRSTLLRLVALDRGGGDVWLDNLRIGSSLAVPTVAASPVISISPNPAGDMVSVRLRLREAGPVRVNLSNASGVVVASQTYGNQPSGERSFSVPTGALPAGIYFVQVIAAGASVTTRLSVVH